MDFDKLFDEVYPGLYRYCLRMTADADAAEDAAQEAFVRLLDRKVRGDGAGLKAWLFKVATHVVRDRVRISDNRRRLLERNPVAPAPPSDPAEVFGRKEEVARVRRALAGLDERDRTLLLLREEGFSYRELGEAVGVKAASIGTLLARARQRFLEAMTEEGKGA